MSARQLLIVGALVLAVLALELGKRTGTDGDRAGAGQTSKTTSSMTTGSGSDKPFVWKVSLDPTGRPYDEPLARGETIERRRLTVLHAPSGRVLFMGGEYLLYPAVDHNVTRVTLRERKGRRYPVDAIWEVHPDGYEGIVGVVIVESDAPVARWRELHSVAYGTDAGRGGITTAEWAALPDDERSRHEREVLYWEGESAAFDLDGQAGIDVVGFNNGFGDGGFPSVAGYDASGARTAIVLWTIVAPWRLAFPEGKPPPQVTQREKQFAACIAGRRKIDGATCRVVR